MLVGFLSFVVFYDMERLSTRQTPLERTILAREVTKGNEGGRKQEWLWTEGSSLHEQRCKTAWTAAQSVIGTTPSPAPTELLFLFETPLFSSCFVSSFSLSSAFDLFRTPWTGGYGTERYILRAGKPPFWSCFCHFASCFFGGAADDPPPSILHNGWTFW
jgi:hypothetical protein